MVRGGSRQGGAIVRDEPHADPMFLKCGLERKAGALYVSHRYIMAVYADADSDLAVETG